MGLGRASPQATRGSDEVSASERLSPHRAETPRTQRPPGPALVRGSSEGTRCLPGAQGKPDGPAGRPQRPASPLLQRRQGAVPRPPRPPLTPRALAGHPSPQGPSRPLLPREAAARPPPPAPPPATVSVPGPQPSPRRGGEAGLALRPGPLGRRMRHVI